jgi:site-specific DNA-methyltransferase (adenine-specific)
MLELNKIYCQDNVQGMKMLDDECIDLTVTSPPYDNLRQYNGYSFDFENVAKELYRVTKQGGVVVWVVGDATIKGSETGTSFRQALYFMECGFKLHDTMIYIKNGGINRGSLKAYQQKFEYMFVFVKGDIKCVNLIRDRKNKYVEDRIKQVRQKDGTYKEHHFKTSEYGVRYNYWIYDTGKHNGEVFNHPAQFPLSLAKDHIISWSNPCNTILDPFMGSGTTAVAALQLGRKYIGFEISQEYVDIANKRIAAETSLLSFF